MMFKPEVIKQKKGENRRSENSRNTRCYHKTSKKCQGKTITRMTAIGPYVVVFWTVSRLVLVRKGCDAAFLLYSQSNMVEQLVTCSWVPKSPGHHASRRQLSRQGSTRVTGLHPKKVKQASKLYPAGTVTR